MSDHMLVVLMLYGNLQGEAVQCICVTDDLTIALHAIPQTMRQGYLLSADHEGFIVLCQCPHTLYAGDPAGQSFRTSDYRNYPVLLRFYKDGSGLRAAWDVGVHARLKDEGYEIPAAFADMAHTVEQAVNTIPSDGRS